MRTIAELEMELFQAKEQLAEERAGRLAFQAELERIRVAAGARDDESTLAAVRRIATAG